MGTLDSLERPGHGDASSSDWHDVQSILLACGVVYPLLYVVANDLIAAALFGDYSRWDQAVSELSARGSPARLFLVAMLPVFSGLLIAFGIGIIRAARRKRSLRVVGVVTIAHGVAGLAWLIAPMSQRADLAAGAGTASDTAHIVLTAVTVVLIVVQMAFGAVAFGKAFRSYSLVSLVIVLAAGMVTGAWSPRLAAGEATPWLGLTERISIGAWLLWMAVLALAIGRARAHFREAS